MIASMSQSSESDDSVGPVELHAHLLPAVDDGCRTVEESIDCARILVANGYTHACCTPHVMPQFPENNRAGIVRRVAALQREYDAAEVGLKLVPGGEMNLMSVLEEGELRLEEVVSYGMLGKWVLFDFWTESPEAVERWVTPGVEKLREAGYELLLAHPERISVLQRVPAVLDGLVGRGVKLQLNAWCLAERPGARVREYAEKWLTAGRYHVLATDLHRIDGMEIRMNGVRRAEELVGVEGVAEMMKRARGVAGIEG